MQQSLANKFNSLAYKYNSLWLTMQHSLALNATSPHSGIECNVTEALAMEAAVVVMAAAAVGAAQTQCCFYQHADRGGEWSMLKSRKFTILSTVVIFCHSR